MTQARLDALLARQMPDADKRRLAHFLIDTGAGHEAAAHAVDDLLRTLAGKPGRPILPARPEAAHD